MPLKLLIENPTFDLDYVLEERNKNEPQNLYIKGPFLMAEEKNKNGRIYPINEMQSEVDRYLTEMVGKKRSLGELNHPSCMTKDAKILTSDGWKFINEISDDERVYTLNSYTNKIECHQIVRKIDEKYSGKLLHIKGRNIDLKVTPNHKIPLIRRNGDFELVEAQEIYKNRNKYNKSYIPKTGEYTGYDVDVINIPRVDGIDINLYDIDPSQDLELCPEVFVKLLGFWLAEGWTNYDTSYVTGISQNDGDVLAEFERDVIDHFPKGYWRRHEESGKNATHVTYTTTDRRLYEYLSPLGKCYDKYIPTEIKQLPSRLLSELLYWYNKGDGRDQETWSGYRVKNNFTTSERLIEDLAELQLKCGKSGNISTIITEADYEFAGHIIKAENKVPLYQLHESTTKGIYLDERFLSIEEVDFDDRVYCVEVPNHIFYVMENGKACWTGNSCDVNPERACHMITDLWRENNVGNIFYGKSKILNTPMGNIVKSLIMEGVQLGVSSRALGKLSPTSGGNTVSNLHLICCDVVHDPSVPTAFVDGILESKDWIINADGTIAEVMDQSFYRMERNLKTMPVGNTDEYLRNVIIDFLNSIK